MFCHPLTDHLMPADASAPLNKRTAPSSNSFSLCYLFRKMKFCCRQCSVFFLSPNFFPRVISELLWRCCSCCFLSFLLFIFWSISYYNSSWEVATVVWMLMLSTAGLPPHFFTRLKSARVVHRWQALLKEIDARKLVHRAEVDSQMASAYVRVIHLVR